MATLAPTDEVDDCLTTVVVPNSSCVGWRRGGRCKGAERAICLVTRASGPLAMSCLKVPPMERCLPSFLFNAASKALVVQKTMGVNLAFEEDADQDVDGSYEFISVSKDEPTLVVL